MNKKVKLWIEEIRLRTLPVSLSGVLIAIGIAAMFMFQIFANIGVATSILPNTGLPLPFLSYGLSSMVSSMIGIGLVLNIGLQGETKEKEDFSLYEL